MRTWVKTLLIGAGVFFLIDSAIFVIAGLTQPPDWFALVTGMILLLIGTIPIIAVIVVTRSENKRPLHMDQNISIDGGDLVGGERSAKDIVCSGCGASLSGDDIRFTEMGMMVRCPYCDKVYTVHEKPKW